MFGRDRTTEATEPDPELEPVQTVPAPPKLTPEQVMQRYILTPSNFASRRADREAKGIPDRPARQLVSLGITEHIQRTPRKGSRHIPGDDVEVLEVELYAELGHSARRYYRIVGDTVIQPIFDNSTPPPKSTPLGVIKAAGFGSKLHPPAGPDQPRPV